MGSIWSSDSACAASTPRQALKVAEEALHTALRAVHNAQEQQHEQELLARSTSSRAARSQRHNETQASTGKTARGSSIGDTVQDDARSVLCSEVVTLRVEGEDVRVHSDLLRRSPYFEARLDRWDCSTLLDVDLPDGCGMADLLEVLHHLYCSHAQWTITDAMAALRAAAVADKLQLESMLPGLAQIVLRWASAADIAQVRRALESHWPDVFLQPLRPLTRVEQELDGSSALEMVKSAVAASSSDAVINAVCTIFASHRGLVVNEAVVEALALAIPSLGNLPIRRLRWLLSVLSERVEPASATTAFARLATVRASVCCANCWQWSAGTSLPTAHAEALRDAFEQHLVRCTGSDVYDAFLLGSLRVGACPCGAALSDNVLAFSAAWSARLPRIAGVEKDVRVALVSTLASLPPRALRPLLTPEFLQKLPAEEQCDLVERLANDLNELITWASSQQWSLPIRVLSRMPWPANQLVPRVWPRRHLADVPWSSAQCAAHALQPVIARLPHDMVSMVAQLCGGDRTSEFGSGRVGPNRFAIIRDVAAVLIIASGQLVPGILCVAILSYVGDLTFGIQVEMSMACFMMVVMEALVGLRGCVCLFLLADYLFGEGANVCFLIILMVGFAYATGLLLKCQSATSIRVLS